MKSPTIKALNPMNTKAITAISLALSLLAGCATTGSRNYNASAPSSNGLDSLEQRRIIRNVSLDLEVSDLESSMDQTKKLIADSGGYIANVNRGEKSISIVAKVPEPKIDNTTESISKLGRVVSKNLNSQDVTEEAIDIESKIANLHLLRDRFRKLLEKANQVTDILAIEKELSRIQTEIDSIEGRQKALSSKVEFSQLDLEIQRKTIYGPLGYVAKGCWWVVKKLFVIR